MFSVITVRVANFVSITLIAVCFVPLALAEDEVSFRREIAPILREQCSACHGPKKSQGGYRVDSYTHAIKAGDSGIPGFTAGELEGSESFRRMSSSDHEERMPKAGNPLSEDQLNLFKRWLKQGAKYDAADPHASLVSIVPPTVHRASPEKYLAAVPLTAIAFSADGETILTGGYHELLLWDAANGKLKQRVGNLAQRLYSISLKPDGSQWAIACGTPGRLGEVRIFSADDYQLITVLTLADDVVFDAAWSPDGKKLAVASSDGSIRLFETESWKQTKVFTSHSDWVYAVAWNAEGTRLASASRDKSAKAFLVETGELTTSYTDHAAPVRGVAWHSNGTEVNSLGAEGRLRRWKASDGKSTSETSLGTEANRFTQAGNFLFAPGSDKKVRMLKAADFAKQREFSAEKSAFLSTSVHQASGRVAGGCADGKLFIWNYGDGRKVVEFTAVPR